MKISVIIPVYNAAKYVPEAVDSALNQEETNEVILIEDGSRDDSLKVCRELLAKDKRIKLYRHFMGRNLGAAASRNLGMKKAKNDYIAFLDADDFYLDNRFKRAKQVFNENPRCAGVYEAIGTVFEGESAIIRWKSSKEMPQLHITMRGNFEPEELLERLVKGGSGYFSPDGLVFKRSLIKQIGLMNTRLRLHEDNEFIFRLAQTRQLFPGSLKKPVTMRRVHTGNSITLPRSEFTKFNNRLRMWSCSYGWFRKNGSENDKTLILKRLFSHIDSYLIENPEPNPLIYELKKRIILLKVMAIEPSVVCERLFQNKFLPARFRMR